MNIPDKGIIGKITAMILFCFVFIRSNYPQGLWGFFIGIFNKRRIPFLGFFYFFSSLLEKKKEMKRENREIKRKWEKRILLRILIKLFLFNTCQVNTHSVLDFYLYIHLSTNYFSYIVIQSYFKITYSTSDSSSSFYSFKLSYFIS